MRVMTLEVSSVSTSGNRLLPISALFLLIVISAAVVGPWLSSYTVGGLEAARLLEAPSATHWMGTDGLGRDLLIRVLYGARVSLTVGLGTAAIALIRANNRMILTSMSLSPASTRFGSTPSKKHSTG